MELRLKPDDGNLVNLNLSGKLDNALVLTLAPFYQGPTGQQGPTGPSGAAVMPVTAGEALGGNRLVVLDSNGAAFYASNADVGHLRRVFGMTLGAASAGSSVDVLRFGRITEPSWSWQLELPVFLGVNGLLTQTPPVFGQAFFSLVVGFPISNNEIFLDIGEPITLGV